MQSFAVCCCSSSPLDWVTFHEDVCLLSFIPGEYYDVLRIVDVMCCVAILLPIAGSIRHLQEADKADGKGM